MKNLKKINLLKRSADEGGFWPCFDKSEEILKFLSKIIEKCGFKYLLMFQ